jgi:hypothetical protein
MGIVLGRGGSHRARGRVRVRGQKRVPKGPISPRPWPRTNGVGRKKLTRKSTACYGPLTSPSSPGKKVKTGNAGSLSNVQDSEGRQFHGPFTF